MFGSRVGVMEKLDSPYRGSKKIVLTGEKLRLQELIKDSYFKLTHIQNGELGFNGRLLGRVKGIDSSAACW